MRLFIAIDFPPELRGALAADTERLRRFISSGRFTPRENYHLTLVFLGETPPDRLGVVVEAMEECPFASFPLSVGELGRFRRREGDILWRRVDGGQPLSQLQAGLCEALRQRGFSIEEREFRPHLTLARRAVLPEGSRLENISGCLTPVLHRAGSMVLFRSRGGTYTPLHTVRAV